MEVRSSSLKTVFLQLTDSMLNYLLYKTKLTPRSLAVLGLIGTVLWLVTAPLSMFGFNPEPMEFLALPIAAQEMILAVWLIIKGFNSSEPE